MADEKKIEVWVSKETKENPDAEVQALADNVKVTAQNLAASLSENGFAPKGIKKDGEVYDSAIIVNVSMFTRNEGQEAMSPSMTINSGTDKIEIRTNNRAEMTSAFVKRYEQNNDDPSKQGWKSYRANEISEDKGFSKETVELVSFISKGIEQTKDVGKSADKPKEADAPAKSDKDANKDNSGIQIYANKNLDYVVEDKREIAGKVIDFVADHAAKALAKNLDEHNIVPKGIDKEGKEYNSSIKVTVDTQKDDEGKQTFKPMLNIPNGKDTIEVHLKRVENDERNNYVMSSVTIKQFDNEGAHHFKLSDAPELSAGTAEIANHISNSIELANISYEANTQVFSSGDKTVSNDNAVVNEAFCSVKANDKSFAQALIDNGFANDNVKEMGLDSVQFRNHTDKQVVYIGKTPDNELVAVAVNYHQREDGKFVSKMIQSSDDLSFITDPQIAQAVSNIMADAEMTKEAEKGKNKSDIER